MADFKYYEVPKDLELHFEQLANDYSCSYDRETAESLKQLAITELRKANYLEAILKVLQWQLK